jgi:hypothetical protein
MSEMINRVAIALCVADGRDPYEDWRVTPGGTMLDVAIRPGEEQRWRLYVKKSRAAIAAMREPTEEMLCAGEECDTNGPNASWQAMIDKALTGK